MTEKEQIEELTRFQCADCGEGCKDCPYNVTICPAKERATKIYNANFRKQADSMDKFEAVDKFRDALMDAFLHLCRYNDYNKLTLLKIGDTVDRVYDQCIESMKGAEDERKED